MYSLIGFIFLSQDYMRQTGLNVLFPKVASYLSNPERPQFFSQKSAMDGNKS